MTKEDSINYLIGELKKDELIDTNLIRDGYHSFGELYEHRVILYVALCRIMANAFNRVGSGYAGNQLNPVWRSKKHSDASEFTGWFILGIFHSKGMQITYHLPMDKWKDTEFALTMDQAPEWDKHTPEDVLKRIKLL